MKRLLLLFAIVFTLSATAIGQDSTKVGRIATPNEAKDTLYVIEPMYAMVVSMWDKPQYETEKPVFIPVRSLEAYLRRYNN